MTGIDILTPRQFFHDVGRSVPQAFAVDHDQSAGLGLDGVARLYIGDSIATDNLPIGATGQNPAGQLWATVPPRMPIMRRSP